MIKYWGGSVVREGMGDYEGKEEGGLIKKRCEGKEVLEGKCK